jgi:hypothetical protein
MSYFKEIVLACVQIEVRPRVLANQLRHLTYRQKPP